MNPRSLRLDFEVNMEVYDEEIDGRREPERVRDSLAKLCSPYL